MLDASEAELSARTELSLVYNVPAFLDKVQRRGDMKWKPIQVLGYSFDVYISRTTSFVLLNLQNTNSSSVTIAVEAHIIAPGAKSCARWSYDPRNISTPPGKSMLLLTPGDPAATLKPQELFAFMSWRVESLDEFVANGLLVGGSLRLRLNICFSTSEEEVLGFKPQQQWDAAVALQNDMDGLLNSCAGADVVLVSNGQEHQAHSFILGARSQVFARMFETNMLEKSKRRVEIKEIASRTMQEFLYFMYTGCMKEDTLVDIESLSSLMLAADKYQVESLRQECIVSFSRLLRSGTALRILAIADSVQQQDLKRKVLTYATATKERLGAIMETDEFDHLDPKLCKEFFMFSTGLGKKRKLDDANLEFADSSSWNRLTHIQLQRACDERSLNSLGSKPELIMRLECSPAAHLDASLPA